MAKKLIAAVEGKKLNDETIKDLAKLIHQAAMDNKK